MGALLIPVLVAVVLTNLMAQKKYMSARKKSTFSSMLAVLSASSKSDEVKPCRWYKDTFCPTRPHLFGRSHGIVNYNMNGRLRRVRWVLSPSLISGVTVILATLAALAIASWSYITDSQLFYDQLFSPYGAVTLLQTQQDSFSAINSAVLNGQNTYMVVLLAGSVIVGLTVYMVLESMSYLIHGTPLFVRSVTENIQAARQAARYTLLRLGLHIASLIAWAIYLLLFISVLLPLSLGLLQVALNDIAAGIPSSWLYLPFCFILLAAGLHMHIVFARLTFLKIRIFGGLDAEMSHLEADSHSL
jgi:hypothetical protein